MCGIAGVVGTFPTEQIRQCVARMNATLVHRGPDDAGEWAAEGVGFGMRRLSIIDLAGGHQPLWSEDGVGIVFNGEIYNYQALRAELAAQGYSFHTHSDTEVILQLYRRDGLAGIARLEGMFAICLYDPRQRVLHLVRDRLGKKPLYYGRQDGGFYFGSEIKALLAGMARRPELDRQAVHHYLTLRFVPMERTVWQGIHKLPPGHSLSLNLDSGEVEINRYWQLRFRSEALDPGRDYVGEFERLFLGAVEKRLMASDVPVGVLLSGGLDSSAVSAAAVELGHRDFHTFSVFFRDGGDFDESPYARQVANHVGANHHEIGIGQGEFLDFLPQLVRFTDEPLADLASVPLYYVSRLAREQVKVVLSGEGSDEVLAGYNFEKLARMLCWLRPLPNWLAALASPFTVPRLGRFLAAQGREGWRNVLAAQPYHMTDYWSAAEKRGLWREDAASFAGTHALIRGWYNEGDPHAHPLDTLQQVYCRDWLVEDLLMKADKMSMAASLELRVPFLDHALVEWAERLPMEWKVGGGLAGYASKRILREFCRRRLPAEVLARPKRGFPVPAYGWLQGETGAWAASLLGSDARINDYFRPEAVQTVLVAARRGEMGAAHRSWILIVLELWLREWL